MIALFLCDLMLVLCLALLCTAFLFVCLRGCACLFARLLGWLNVRLCVFVWRVWLSVDCFDSSFVCVCHVACVRLFVRFLVCLFVG